LLPRSLGPTPEQNNKFPTFLECGYAPTGSGALLESNFSLDMFFFFVKIRKQ
jgi:hypothetical protein